MKKIAAILAVMVLCFCLAGCGGGGSGGLSTQGEATTFSFSSEIIIDTQTIGNGGGIISTPIDSPISEVIVEFPAGALQEDTAISIGYNPGVLISSEGEVSNTAIVLRTDGQDNFDQPIKVTFPFSGENVVPVPYYIDINGLLHPVDLIEIDRVNHTATFCTFHASLYSWVLEKLGLTSTGESYSTGYKPEDDGFQTRNRRSDYNREGECFGMTSFSLWYFMNHKGEGNFYPRFMNTVGTDSGGDSLKGQDIIATRAFISISQQWTTYYSPIADNEKKGTNEDCYSSIRRHLKDTHNPVLIYLFHKSEEEDAHSVLAYAYNEIVGPGLNQGRIFVYNPNDPGETETIIYDEDDKSFETYSGYDGIVYNGDGSLSLTEPYKFILEDAKQNFNSSANAIITLSSHFSGDDIYRRNTNLQGNINSGQVAVNLLQVFVGSTSFKADVGYAGSFTLPISLQQETNHLQFVTKGRNAAGNLIELPNNMTVQDFTLDGIFDTAVILVTLTWDTADTDIDLYVVDPIGDYSCFYHKITADGGELDHDIVSGYGPEHWTLTDTDNIRWGEDYRVRLHYYSDHGYGPSNYTVSIFLYEGTNRETVSYYRGNLSVSNSGNNQPNGTGADWVDIAVVRPIQAATRARSILIPDNNLPVITVPIPSLSERTKVEVEN